jgi:hypothetical protein
MKEISIEAFGKTFAKIVAWQYVVFRLHDGLLTAVNVEMKSDDGYARETIFGLEHPADEFDTFLKKLEESQIKSTYLLPEEEPVRRAGRDDKIETRLGWVIHSGGDVYERYVYLCRDNACRNADHYQSVGVKNVQVLEMWL